MLAYLRGTLQTREVSGGPADRIVLDVAGVGFELTVSSRTALQCGDLGETVCVHTALSIRENEWTIFGFANKDEREMFSLLQSVSGIGPKMALSLVGTLGISQIVDAILDDDQKMLAQAPGVGTKVAQRIILELKSKVEDWQISRGAASTAGVAKNQFVDEARAILEGLGYTPTEISHAFKKAQEDSVGEDVEVLVRHSLKVLGAAGR